LEHAARHPDHAVVLADLDPELDGLSLGALWTDDWEKAPLALSCSEVRSDKEHAPWGAG
jgi:hypothetical protein